MVFSSLLFVFLFLVASYSIYLLCGKTINAKNVILLVSSLIFYAWGGPALVSLLCLMAFICWAGAIIIDNAERKKLRLALCWATVAVCIAILIIFKYTVFAITNVYALFNIDSPIPSIALPIGISFYTFQLISYVIDVYRGEVKAQRKYWHLLLYASLFHQCIAGPIVRYADVENDIENRVMKREEISRGITRFAFGLAKKAVLANGCGAIVDAFFTNSDTGALMTAGEISALPALAVIIGVFAYMLQLYLDFSAYSDMAIGMGLMIGFHYKENFNYPYVATSVNDFWRRWHISLSTFFRDYVYIPLGGNRVTVPRHIINMFVVWALTGFWHGASWNYLFWGLYWFVFLVLEKYLIKPKKNPQGLIRIGRTALTLVIVFFASMLFKFEDLSSLGQAFLNLFGRNGFTDAATNLVLKNNMFFIIFASIASTPIVPAVAALASKTRATAAVSKVVGALIPAALVVVSAICLAGNSYNPFLYFQF